MQGQRKPKTPTKAEMTKHYTEMQQALENAQLQAAMLKLEIRRRTANMMTQTQVLEGIFMAALQDAGTIGEARAWFKQWAKDVNGIDISSEGHTQAIADLIARHGFEIIVTQERHYADVDAMWQRDREEQL